MKLAIILSTSRAETNWNALRLANVAISKGDIVNIFLTGDGVEYMKNSSDAFDINKQVQKFLQSTRAAIIACGTCMMVRKQGSSETCPGGGIEDLYTLVAESDKVTTF